MEKAQYKCFTLPLFFTYNDDGDDYDDDYKNNADSHGHSGPLEEALY